jgi:dihydrofolate synthase/folylpolyglutamate synthase
MANHSTLAQQASGMTYEEAIAFWFGRINYEQRTPRLTDLKLDRMRTLLGLLGNPQDQLRIVHVAGSKGKGSTSAMLECILRHAGYRTGLFTSPHLCQVEERIQVDARPIPPQALAALMNEIRAAIARMEDDDLSEATTGQGTTFFEVATALGFLYFARQEVDVAVVEVGLGGRFDSTNVCRPLVSVITSISFDHTQQLGNRLAEIAMEKAGIVKPDRPTISGVTDPEPRQVIEAICRERHSSMRQLGADFRFQYQPGQVFKEETRNQKPKKPPVVRVTTGQRAWPAMKLGLWGEHQAANAALAVACVELLRDQGLRIADAAVASGLANVQWPARMEIVSDQPLVVLDCAHNVASAQALVETLRTSFPPTESESHEPSKDRSMAKDGLRRGALGKRVLIFAGSSDKDLAGILKTLAASFDHVFLTRYSHSPRAVAAERLSEIIREQSPVPFTICPTPADAWRSARGIGGPDDLICITGSVFLAGELRPLVMRDCRGWVADDGKV